MLPQGRRDKFATPHFGSLWNTTAFWVVNRNSHNSGGWLGWDGMGWDGMGWCPQGKPAIDTVEGFWSSSLEANTTKWKQLLTPLLFTNATCHIKMIKESENMSKHVSDHKANCMSQPLSGYMSGSLSTHVKNHVKPCVKILFIHVLPRLITKFNLHSI